MDFDHRFDFKEFIAHFQDLRLLDDENEAKELIKRTTKDTRGGDAFSFKPTHLWIGTSSGRSHRFHTRFDCEIEPKGLNPQIGENAKPGEREIPSSFWFRFNSAGDRFQFRAFCSEQKISALRPYEAILQFRDVVRGGVELHAQKNGSRVLAHLTIRSRRPPRATVLLMSVIPRKQPIFDRLATEVDFFQLQNREEPNEAEAGSISPLGSEKAVVKIGLWLTHKFSFDLSRRHYKLFWQCMIRLRLIHLQPVLRTSLSIPHSPRPGDHLPVAFSSFETRYLVEGLIANGTVNETELNSLHKTMRHFQPAKWSLIIEGFFKGHRNGNIGKDVKDIVRRMAPPPPIPSHCMLVRRCLVTPTRCLLQPPQLETSNSMLRAFKHHQDRFIRVQFEEEDEALQITAEILDVDAAVNCQKGIFARIRRALRFGLYIAGRQYVFLCFGESQIKEHGCWMISETEDFTVQAVLSWMGDLSEERNIAKHAARQGLVLSTSRGIDLSHLDIKVEYDLADITVTNPETGTTHIFTDGMGQCSQELVNYCSRTMGYDYRQSPSSAVQVRVGGGSKGVLCVVPDSIIKGNLVKVRKSMIKFRSRDTLMLNVLKVSCYGVAYLNRQAIVLLEEQGVPSDLLLRLFMEEKRRIEYLEQNIERQTFVAMTEFPLAQTISSGFTEDPLIQDIVNVLKCRLLSDLKWKARFPIEEGAYLIGVSDETGTLDEGQIFCQIDGQFGRRVITSTCTIFKNPCLHPGDVRRVQAVENPSLSYLINVIVFPTRGTQDIPSMMSGGDLDGDHYTLLWDEQLVIPREHKPMDYTHPPSKKVPPWKTITVDDTKEFWLEYVKSDILGLICNAHLAFADIYSPSCDECLRLAKLASQAVDFSKTGLPVDRTSYTPPPSYPDFMGKHQMPKRYQDIKGKPVSFHESKKVLGHMFRSIDPEPVFKPAERDAGWEPPFTGPLPKEWEAYVQEAAALKRRYDFELNGVLQRYRMCEAECVSGVLMRSRARHVRIDRDYTLREAVREVYAELASFFRSQAMEYLKSFPVTKDKGQDRRAWALACYKVTYDKSYSQYASRHLNLVDEPQTDSDSEDEGTDLAQELNDAAPEMYYSFPWLFHKELFELADGGMQEACS